MDQLYNLLVLNENLVVEINSHTDNRGDLAYNIDLSQRRAESAVQYIISQGITANRIAARGYGETRPIANNESAAGREKNRRIDVVIKLDKAKAQAKPETFGDLPDVPPVAPAAAP